MKSLTIRIDFEDDFKIPECLMLGTEVEKGVITASARYDLFKTMDIAEVGLENINTTVAEDILEEIRNTQ